MRTATRSGAVRGVAIGTVAVLLAACGGGGPSSETSAPVDSASVSTVAATTTTVTGTVTIAVTVGTDSSPDRRESVALGSSVEVTLVNPDSHDEFHLHGYDVSTGTVDAGESATIAFTADKAGTFELESHETGDVLVTLVVE